MRRLDWHHSDLTEGTVLVSDHRSDAQNTHASDVGTEKGMKTR